MVDRVVVVSEATVELVKGDEEEEDEVESMEEIVW